MIRKTRISFVVVTMTLLAAVIVFFVGTTIFINYRTSRDSTNYLLFKILFRPEDQAEVNRPVEDNPNDRTCYALFDCLVTNNCVYVQDKSIVGNMFDNPSDADGFVKKIIVDGVLKSSSKNENGTYCGNVGSLYYALKQSTNSGNVRIAVIDRALEEEMLTSTTLTLTTLSVVALLAIFVIVWLLSYRVVKPVSDAFDKQRRFISDASHELKTPVTIIRANAEALQSESDESTEWADNILSQTDRLTHLVEEMLTLARFEEKQVVKQHIDLSATVEAAALEFEPVAYEQNKKFVMNVDQSVTAYVDGEDVRRVVSLLVDNAVKYGETFVDIKFFRLAHGGKLVVTNDGCQVPAEHKDKLFERFYREDSSRTRDTGGSGLGLAAVKALCERNKWKVYIDCALGGTMTVTVEMC